MDDALERFTFDVEERHWWYRGRRAVLAAVLDGLGPPSGAGASATRILDAGCGSGRNMVELARRGAVTGVELASQSLEVARARDLGPVVPGSLDDPLPFDDASFDLAVALDVLEHVADDAAALRELARVVAPGGRLLVTVPQYALAVGRARRPRPPPPPLYASAAAGAGRRRGLRGRARDARSTRVLLPAIAVARARAAGAAAGAAGIRPWPHPAGRGQRGAGAHPARRGRAHPPRARPAGRRVAARGAAAPAGPRVSRWVVAVQAGHPTAARRELSRAPRERARSCGSRRGRAGRASRGRRSRGSARGDGRRDRPAAP